MKKIIIISGPTAAGKSALAVDTAISLHTDIIGVDSRQIYKGIPILTAVPSIEQRGGVTHHLIDILDLHTPINAFTYESMAMQKIEEILQKKDTVVICGGSMMYLDAIAFGIDMIPDIPANIRNECVEEYNEKGLEWLKNEIKNIDYKYYNKTDSSNPRRLLRALETYRTTGKTLSSFHTGSHKKRSFEIDWHLIMPERTVLYDRINQRVDKMIDEGALQEAEKVWQYRHLNSLQTVGFRELFAYLDGEISLDYAIEQIKRNTRIYAKKQILWCKKKCEIASRILHNI